MSSGVRAATWHASCKERHIASPNLYCSYVGIFWRISAMHLYYITVNLCTPVPVAARSKAYVCCRSPAEILGSNPTGGMDICLLWVSFLSGRGLCNELITRPEGSCRLCCVVVCDLETSRMGAPYIYDISRLRVKCIRTMGIQIEACGTVKSCDVCNSNWRDKHETYSERWP